MDNSNQFVLADHKQATIDLTNEIKNKLDYLQSLGRAVQAQDDRMTNRTNVLLKMHMVLSVNISAVT